MIDYTQPKLPIQFKRSCVSGIAPSACEIAEGELAINLADGVIYSKDCYGTVTPLSGGDIDGGTYAGAVVSYNCGPNFTCVPVAGSGGSYATLADCQSLCVAPVLCDLPVGSTITIPSQPTSRTAVSGAASLSITAASSSSEALTFSWQWWNTWFWVSLVGTTGTMPYGNGNGFSWSASTSGSSSTLSLTNVVYSEKFRCIVGSSTQASVSSNEVSVSQP
jgi:hypothetical protein